MVGNLAADLATALATIAAVREHARAMNDAITLGLTEPNRPPGPCTCTACRIMRAYRQRRLPVRRYY